MTKKTAKKPLTFQRKEGLYLKPAGAKGRGVFCLTDIKKGEILEVTPALLLDPAATDLADKTILRDYTFAVGEIHKRHKLKKPELSSAVVMGIQAFCNHGGKEQNAEISWDETTDTVYYILTAKRDIKAGTEICTTYGSGWFDDRK